MRTTFLASLGLALGLFAARALAEEPDWQPVPAASATLPPAVRGLKAPIPDDLPVHQAAFNSTTPDGKPLPAKQAVDSPGQPLPIGPILNNDEKGPAPTPLNNYAPTVIEHPPGTVGPVPGYVSGPFDGMPGGIPGGMPGGIPGGMPGAPSCGCNSGMPAGMPGQCCGDCCGECCPSCVEGFVCDDCCGSCCGLWNNICDICCCCPCDCCAPRSCFWVRGEYLLWTVKSSPTPPLVTLNGNPGAPPVIGVPGTVTIFGGNSEDFNLRSGGRFTVGFAVPCTNNNLGFEATYFFLADRSTGATFASPGNPTIGRPFTDVGPALTGFPGNQNAELVAFPGLVGGSVKVNTSNEIWGVEGNLRYPICCGCNYKVDFLGGFRYVQMDENLQIVEDLNVQQPTSRGVGNIVVIDQFTTHNRFYGGQVGIDAECRWGRWFVSGTGKLALGDMQQTVAIDGATMFANGPNPGVERGGLLAQQGTNIGRYSRDTFAVVPELGLRLGFYFTEHLRGYVGYDVLYASTVVRPGDQIDTNINPTFLARNGPSMGVPQPRFDFRTTDFWAQGVSFGLEWRY